MNEGCDGGESSEGVRIGTKENTDEKIQTTLRRPGNRMEWKAPSEIRPHGVNNIQYLLGPYEQPASLRV